MHIDDIIQALLPQGITEDEIRYSVDQLIQNMTIYESNPNMYNLQ